MNTFEHLKTLINRYIFQAIHRLSIDNPATSHRRRTALKGAYKLHLILNTLTKYARVYEFNLISWRKQTDLLTLCCAAAWFYNTENEKKTLFYFQFQNSTQQRHSHICGKDIRKHVAHFLWNAHEKFLHAHAVSHC